MKIVSRTQTELATLFKIFKEFYGDDFKVEGHSNVATYLQSLLNMLGENYYTHILNQVTFSFITGTTAGTTLDLLEAFGHKLNILTLDNSNDKRLVLISGTLLAWKECIAMSGQYNSKIELRHLMSLAYNEFKTNEKLAFIWEDFDISARADKTLLFIERK